MSTTTYPSSHLQPSPPAANEPVVHAIGLTKIFRDFWLRPKARAVDGISFQVHRGEVFGLLGPNGSGKSTTIKLILGLLRPTAGRVLVFGKLPHDVATKKRIGYLPEETYLYRFLNARETLDYYGRLFSLDRTQRRRRIDRLLEMVGLEAVARRPVGEYSKGMQRRIGLAQALINDPDLLILDEPTTGMDPIGSRQIKDLIRELSRRGKTVILCSHLLADVEDVCHRVAIMFGGKIRAMGTVDELLTRSDRLRLELPALDEQTIVELEQLLQRRGQHIEKLERPRVKLETLFLDIVQRAQAEGIQTSGATAGGAIADFLRAPTPPPTEGQALLQQLLQPSAPAPASAPVAPAPAPPAPPPADQELLETLLASPQPPSTPASPTDRGPQPAGTPSPPEPAPSSPPPLAPPPPEEPDRDLLQALTQPRQPDNNPSPPAP